MKNYEVFICTHSNLGKSFLDAVEMLAGEQEHVSTFALMPGTGLDDFRKMISAASEKVSKEKYVVIFTDLAGGTPSNASAMEFGMSDRHFIINGCNVPMLLELCMTDTIDDGVIDSIQQIGRDSICLSKIQERSDTKEDF